jgi:hypothetical protein
MTKLGNISGSVPFRVTVSKQSMKLLEQLAARGIYGRNAAEVAARFIDKALEQFIEVPKLKVEGEKK